MNNLNQILLEGNLTEDPAFTSGQKVISASCEFMIVSNRYLKQEDDDDYKKCVSYFKIVAFGALAENCGEQLIKGRSVRVIGKLNQNYWTDEDGKTHSEVRIIAEHVVFKPVFKTKGH